jgi:hypothetical protein
MLEASLTCGDGLFSAVSHAFAISSDLKWIVHIRISKVNFIVLFKKSFILSVRPYTTNCSGS